MESGINYLVIKNMGMEFEGIYYCGKNELEARRAYKKLNNGKKNIIKADVTIENHLNVPFIMNYKTLEVIR